MYARQLEAVPQLTGALKKFFSLFYFEWFLLPCLQIHYNFPLQ